ncbi:hypothetical protein [Streptomyces sp. NPDC015125]|uniref:hypothetical protein n=1 Tax=Streptomyces sp. NPDC015125 TaxID=3364938 RepID=UPI0036F557D6
MTENNADLPRLTLPKLVMNPELPERLQKAIRISEHRDLLAPDPHSEPSPWLGLVAPIRAKTVLCVAALSLAQPWRFVEGLSSVTILLQVLLGLGCWSAIAVAERRARRRHLLLLREARDAYVLPEELDEVTRELLVRAYSAVRLVLYSSVHREDLIDRQRNEQMLPAEVWEIAAGLASYRRLMDKLPKTGKGEQAEKQLHEQRRKLGLSLGAIESTVIALEAYAVEVMKADARYAEHQQLHELAEWEEEVLDLLARSARADHAVAETRRVAGEAAAVSEALTSALRSVQEAAVVALPAPREVH